MRDIIITKTVKLSLKPCPFCGSEVYIDKLEGETADDYLYMIACENEKDCGAAMSFGERYDIEDVVKVYNRRNRG